MSNAALRSVFAEFGFDIDEAALDALEKKLRAVVGSTKQTTKATDETAKANKAAADAAKKHAKEQEALAKKVQADAEKLKTFSGIVELVADRLAGKLGASITRANPKLAELARSFGLNDEAAGKVAIAITGATAAVLAFVARAAFAFGAQFAQDAEALRDVSREARITTTQLQELDHAAIQSGVGQERMRAGVTAFGQALRAGERWGNGTTFMLRRLGVQARDTNGRIRPTGELLDEVAVALERVQNPYRRARVATQLFGESGRRMLDVLHTGPGGIRALRQELEELGGGVTPEAVEASRRFTQAQERASRAFDSLRSVLAVTLLPVLSRVLDFVARGEGLFARLTRGTHVVEIALAALGAAGAFAAARIIAAWLPVVAPFVFTAVKIALLIALIDDLITFVEGGDSAIGRLIDTLFGVGESAQLVKELRDDWEAVVGAVERAIAAVARFTGMEAAPALGTLRAPRFGTPPRRSAATATASAAAPAPVRATQAVAAPGGVVNNTSSVRNTVTNHTQITVQGAGDPRAVADEIERRQRAADRARRDADHPGEDVA